VILLIIVFFIAACSSSESQVKKGLSSLSVVNSNLAGRTVVGLLKWSLLFILAIWRAAYNTCFLVGDCKSKIEKEDTMRDQVDKEKVEALIQSWNPLLFLLLEIRKMWNNDPILV
jgi:hypothetical protein